MNEKDVWYAAKILIDCYPNSAITEAASRKDRAQGLGKTDAASDWTRVGVAIASIQALPAMQNMGPIVRGGFHG